MRLAEKLDWKGLILICGADCETRNYEFLFVLVLLFPPRVSTICSHSCYENV
jgi:hypothetical protein